jgi:hypothetical protein
VLYVFSDNRNSLIHVEEMTLVDVVCAPGSTVPGGVPEPILLAAQYNNGDERTAIEQLAQIFHTTLVLFVLYYLDLRGSLDQQIPKWMVLYGIVYNEEGFTIKEFFPTFHFGKDKTFPFNWGACSASTTSFTGTFQLPPANRSRSLMALTRIRSHARAILQRFVEWKRWRSLMEHNFTSI